MVIITERNPLLIDLVIENLVTFLPEKELKSCRLVCWKWYLPATEALQKVAKPITFGDLYKVNLIRLRPDLETIKLFMSAMNESEFLPYVKFDIRPSVLAPNCLRTLEEFLNNFGHVIEDLSISLAYESSDSFSKGCFPFMNLRNLRNLDFCNTIRGEMRPSLRTDLLTTRYNLLQSIIRTAPNLEKLSLWCDSENLAWPGEAIEVLRLAELPKLKNLKISFPMTNFQLANLARIPVRLTTLTFLIREPIFNSEHFYNFLKTQEDTLENLKLVDLQCDQYKMVELPNMRKLRHLEIEGAFYGNDCKLAFLNFSFHKKTPTLETLILRNCHSLNFDVSSFLTTSSCRTLKELHVTLAHDFVNKKIIESMPSLFPQLMNLHVMFTPESKDLLTSVFECLGDHLEHLTINVRKCGENIDSVLSGIQNKLIWDKQLTEALKIMGSSREEFTLDDVIMQFNGLKTRPGLTDLKNLRSLELKGEHRNYKPEVRAITEVTAYLAILQAKMLRNLILTHTGKNLSQECHEVLNSRLHVIQIHPDDSLV